MEHENNGKVTLTNSEIKRIERGVRSAARKIGLRQDIDDCVQDVLCEILSGRSQKTNFDNMVIDYLRKQTGKKGSVGYEVRKNINQISQVDSVKHTSVNLPKLEDFAFTSMVTMERFEAKLKKGEMKVFSKLLNGSTITEISSEIGLSASYISQLAKNIRRKYLDLKVKENVVNQILRKVHDEEARKWMIKNFL